MKVKELIAKLQEFDEELEVMSKPYEQGHASINYISLKARQIYVDDGGESSELLPQPFVEIK